MEEMQVGCRWLGVGPVRRWAALQQVEVGSDRTEAYPRCFAFRSIASSFLISLSFCICAPSLGKAVTTMEEAGKEDSQPSAVAVCGASVLASLSVAASLLVVTISF